MCSNGRLPASFLSAPSSPRPSQDRPLSRPANSRPRVSSPVLSVLGSPSTHTGHQPGTQQTPPPPHQHPADCPPPNSSPVTRAPRGPQPHPAGLPACWPPWLLRGPCWAPSCLPRAPVPSAVPVGTPSVQQVSSEHLLLTCYYHQPSTADQHRLKLLLRICRADENR